MPIQVTQKTTQQAASGVAPKAGGSTLSFMKRGQAAQQALQTEEAKAEQAKAARSRLFRFFLKDGEERRVTFVDGTLDADGMLDALLFYEHTVYHNGRWTPFVCVQESEVCPICESGDRPALVGVFTIIDHSVYTDKKGNQHKDQKRLYVPKRGTLRILQTLAGKRGGLAGCTFDISRSGDKAPAVGSLFDFVEKHTLEELQQKYGQELMTPANYADEITYLSAQELLALGVGKAVGGIGQEPAVDTSDVADEL